MATKFNKKFSQISGTDSIDRRKNVLSINDTLQVYHANIAAEMDCGNSYYNANVFIKDSCSESEYRAIYCKYDNLYFDDDMLISTSRLVSEINNVFYPASETSNLITSNISVLGQPDNIYFGYINMSNTQGNDGIGIRYNHASEKIEFKHKPLDSWIDIGISRNISDINDIENVSISNVMPNQIMQYDNQISKWTNQSNMHLSGTLELGGDLIVGNNNIVSLSNKNILTFASDSNSVNYIGLKNANTDTSPELYVDGEDTNISLRLRSKGLGDIQLTSGEGDTNITSSNIYLSSSTSIQSTGYHITSTESQSISSWIAGIENSIVLSTSSDILVLNMTGKSDGIYNCLLNSGQNGQHNTIIFHKDYNSNIKINLKMNMSIEESDYIQTIKFNKSGQTAEVVYIGDGINKWIVKSSFGAEFITTN